VVAVADRTQITRPEKILWPQDGYTKGDLIDYYRAIADWILPYLEDRPLVLDRYPDGIEGDSFFQKHAPHFTPEWIRTVTVHSGSGKRDIDYFVVEDAEALVYMANAAAIPLHVWSSRVSSLDRPDWTILDLDPKEASFGAVVQVARGIRQLCDQIGLECFVKTSGKTGLHVLVPLGGQVDYQQSRMLADLLAMIVSRRLPEIATVNRALHARGGRVYIDAVQNGAGRLLVSPFCVRPYPGAPVSTPLRWREVGPRLDRSRFTIRTVPTRVRRMKAEPLLPILGVRPDLLGALRRLAEIEKGG
jgi:bifunctional non-homologous end joining protein LigD